MSLYSVVKSASNTIKDDRALMDILNHMDGESDELFVEIVNVAQGEPEGEDGVVGEAIDVISCALDIIFRHKPDITEEELDEIMKRKCDKWISKYS